MSAKSKFNLGVVAGAVFVVMVTSLRIVTTGGTQTLRVHLSYPAIIASAIATLAIIFFNRQRSNAHFGKVPAPKELDVYALVDISGTMRKKETHRGQLLTRLDAVKQCLIDLALRLGVSAGKDRLVIIPFSSTVGEPNQVDSDQIEDSFDQIRALGSTNTKDALQLAINNGFAWRDIAGRDKRKSILIVCFTDGAPDDEEGTTQVIVNATKLIGDRSELAIVFVSVGQDGEVEDYLNQLNYQLERGGAQHHIVTVISLDAFEETQLHDLLFLAYRGHLPSPSDSVQSNVRTNLSESASRSV